MQLGRLTCDSATSSTLSTSLETGNALSLAAELVSGLDADNILPVVLSSFYSRECMGEAGLASGARCCACAAPCRPRSAEKHGASVPSAWCLPQRCAGIRDTWGGRPTKLRTQRYAIVSTADPTLGNVLGYGLQTYSALKKCQGSVCRLCRARFRRAPGDV